MERYHIFKLGLAILFYAAYCIRPMLVSGLRSSSIVTNQTFRPEDYNVYYQGVDGTPGVDFPVLSYIPRTIFSCDGVESGYYADLDTDCQVFHICEEGKKISFLCPNGTIFEQGSLICEWWYKVDCPNAPNLYHESAELLREDLARRKQASRRVSLDGRERNHGAVMRIEETASVSAQQNGRPFRATSRPRGQSGDVDVGRLSGSNNLIKSAINKDVPQKRYNDAETGNFVNNVDDYGGSIVRTSRPTSAGNKQLYTRSTTPRSFGRYSSNLEEISPKRKPSSNRGSIKFGSPFGDKNISPDVAAKDDEYDIEFPKHKSEITNGDLRPQPTSSAVKIESSRFDLGIPKQKSTVELRKNDIYNRRFQSPDSDELQITQETAAFTPNVYNSLQTSRKFTTTHPNHRSTYSEVKQPDFTPTKLVNPINSVTPQYITTQSINNGKPFIGSTVGINIFNRGRTQQNEEATVPISTTERPVSYTTQPSVSSTYQNFYESGKDVSSTPQPGFSTVLPSSEGEGTTVDHATVYGTFSKIPTTPIPSGGVEIKLGKDVDKVSIQLSKSFGGQTAKYSTTSSPTRLATEGYVRITGGISKHVGGSPRVNLGSASGAGSNKTRSDGDETVTSTVVPSSFSKVSESSSSGVNLDIPGTSFQTTTRRPGTGTSNNVVVVSGTDGTKINAIDEGAASVESTVRTPSSTGEISFPSTASNVQGSIKVPGFSSSIVGILPTSGIIIPVPNLSGYNDNKRPISNVGGEVPDSSGYFRENDDNVPKPGSDSTRLSFQGSGSLSTVGGSASTISPAVEVSTSLGNDISGGTYGLSNVRGSTRFPIQGLSGLATPTSTVSTDIQETTATLSSLGYDSSTGRGEGIQGSTAISGQGLGSLPPIEDIGSTISPYNEGSRGISSSPGYDQGVSLPALGSVSSSAAPIIQDVVTSSSLAYGGIRGESTISPIGSTSVPILQGATGVPHISLLNKQISRGQSTISPIGSTAVPILQGATGGRDFGSTLPPNLQRSPDQLIISGIGSTIPPNLQGPTKVSSSLGNEPNANAVGDSDIPNIQISTVTPGSSRFNIQGGGQSSSFGIESTSVPINGGNGLTGGIILPNLITGSVSDTDSDRPFPVGGTHEKSTVRSIPSGVRSQVTDLLPPISTNESSRKHNGTDSHLNSFRRPNFYPPKSKYSKTDGRSKSSAPTESQINYFQSTPKPSTRANPYLPIDTNTINFSQNDIESTLSPIASTYRPISSIQNIPTTFRPLKEESTTINGFFVTKSSVYGSTTPTPFGRSQATTSSSVSLTPRVKVSPNSGDDVGKAGVTLRPTLSETTIPGDSLTKAESRWPRPFQKTSNSIDDGSIKTNPVTPTYLTYQISSARPFESPKNKATPAPTIPTPFTTARSVQDNVNSMIDTLKEMVDYSAETPRPGLVIPPSAGPQTLHTLAQYFANALDGIAAEREKETGEEIDKESKEKLTSLLTHVTMQRYNELFKGTGTSTEGSEEATTLGDELDEDDSNNLVETPQLRELARNFSLALSSYLNNPETFRKELENLRPTEPPFVGDEREVTADEELLNFSDADSTPSPLPQFPTPALPSPTWGYIVAPKNNDDYLRNSLNPDLHTADSQSFVPRFNNLAVDTGKGVGDAKKYSPGQWTTSPDATKLWQSTLSVNPVIVNENLDSTRPFVRSTEPSIIGTTSSVDAPHTEIQYDLRSLPSISLNSTQVHGILIDFVNTTKTDDSNRLQRLLKKLNTTEDEFLHRMKEIESNPLTKRLILLLISECGVNITKEIDSNPLSSISETLSASSSNSAVTRHDGGRSLNSDIPVLVDPGLQEDDQDTRALQLLNSLYSIASKFGK